MNEHIEVIKNEIMIHLDNGNYMSPEDLLEEDLDTLDDNLKGLKDLEGGSFFGNYDYSFRIFPFPDGSKSILFTGVNSGEDDQDMHFEMDVDGKLELKNEISCNPRVIAETAKLFGHVDDDQVPA